MATVNPPVKRKILRPPKRPSVPPPPPAEERDYSQAATAIRAVAKAFRLSCRGLGEKRKLTPQQRAQLLRETKINPDMLKMEKVLYAKHPALTKRASAEGRVKKLFEAKTLPYPEGGVRILPVHSLDPAAQLVEVQEFVDEVRQAIADHEQAVTELRNVWPDVLKTNAEQLVEFHDPKNYPSAEALQNLLRISFEPYNVELPEYYKQIAPAEYRRCQEMLQQRFEEAAAKQEQVVVTAFQKTLEQMVASIRGWQDGTQRVFKDSVVENVVGTLQDFREKCQRFGILSGTELEREFQKLEQVMHGQGPTEKLPDLIRKDRDKGRQLVDQVDAIREAILARSQVAPRRVLMRD